MTAQRKASKRPAAAERSNNARSEAVELEAELIRLNALVRARREQLARLEHCPHKDCECRQVWREVVEKKLATQVRKIRKQVRPAATANHTPKGPAKRSR
jgi:hypothetical protein